MELTLPHKYDPRPYQLPFLRAMDSGKKRAILIWHRKSGKEKTSWNFTIKKALERVGNYWYCFPKLVQARSVIWEGIDQDGVKFLDHIPKEIMDGEPNGTLMLIRLKCGSTIQLIGGDNFDNSSVGGNPIGVVLSEYPLQDPQLWSYIRPILANNGGWAVFNGTPRGENHAYDLWCLAKSDPENWHAELLTVDDTKTLPQKILDQERREIIRLHGNDALFLQEYYCSFTVPMAGAYFSDHLMRAYAEGRVGNVPVDPRFPVDTWWDLGVGANMAIWFVQHIGSAINVVDYMSGGAFGLLDYIKKVREKGYTLGRHIAPHDIEGPEISNGKLRIHTAQSVGFEFTVCPKLGVADGIETVSNIFPMCWFDKTKCADGINGLKNYRRQYDEKRRMYLDQPYHDWASHPADAFRTGAVCMDFVNTGKPLKRDIYLDSGRSSSRSFNPMTV